MKLKIILFSTSNKLKIFLNSYSHQVLSLEKKKKICANWTIHQLVYHRQVFPQALLIIPVQEKKVASIF